MAATPALLLLCASLAGADGPLTVKDGDFVSQRGYISSDRCKSCHETQYASWHQSYHRTMTQAVGPTTVVAAGLDRDGHRFEGRGDEFWARFPSGEERRILQSTGSHHYQLYWYGSGHGNELRMFPFVWLNADRRWAPRISVFLTPPSQSEEPLVWNYHCLPCHSTDGVPGYIPDPAGPARPETRVAELGIACEACHGPGKQHAQDRRRDSIIHPQKVPAARSAEICGQCHSVNVPRSREQWADWLIDGPTYKAGERLRDSRHIVERATAAESVLIAGLIENNPTQLDEWFWPDGEVRVTGREYNSLIRSPCYQSGEFTCLNCHSPHADDPDDLLRVGRDSDEACTACHDLGENHTRHTSGSPGSRCYNCHMPNTVYGLLKASRSHEITSPTVGAARPNACNLCHLDKSLDWASAELENGWGIESSAPASELPAGASGLLTGDAAQRALWAWHMGWKPAQQASGSSWMRPFLEATLDDPYDVVRYIAERSLKTLEGPTTALDGLPVDRIDELLPQRDDRPVKLAE